MRDALWLLKFDFKTGWKWHLITFPSLIGIMFVLTNYRNEDFDERFVIPIFTAEMFYVVAFMGIVTIFTYREIWMPKRKQFNHYEVPFIQVMRELPVDPLAIAHFYFLKLVYSIGLYNIVLGFLLYRKWEVVLSVSDYIYFILFWMGIGLVIGFWSIVCYPIKGQIGVAIISILFGVIIFFPGWLILFNMLGDGFIGLILDGVHHTGIFMPIVSIGFALLNYCFAIRVMVKLIERRDYA